MPDTSELEELDLVPSEEGFPEDAVGRNIQEVNSDDECITYGQEGMGSCGMSPHIWACYDENVVCVECGAYNLDRDPDDVKMEI